jgi:hypothetical protein
MTVIDNRFKSTKPVFCAQGRYDDVIICQGESVKPSRWVSGSEAPCTDAGIIAPSEKPVITLDPTPSYYVARTDIKRPGAVYYAPPSIAYSAGGVPPASAKSFLEQSAVSEFRQEEGGKYYPSPPSATLSETYCKAELKALLKLPPTFTVDPSKNDQNTGLTSGMLISSGPPWTDEGNIASDSQYTNYDWWPYLDFPINGNGIGTAERSACRYWLCPGAEGNPGTVCAGPSEYEIAGYTQGSGAIMRLFGGGFSFLGFNNNCAAMFLYSYLLDSAAATTFGKGYNTEGDLTADPYVEPAPLTLTVPASYVRTPTSDVFLVPYTFGLANGGKTGANKYHWEKAAVVQLFSGGDSRNPGAGTGYPIESIEVVNQGSGCLVAPEIKIISNSGFGAYATCTVKNGSIDTVTVENPGGGYTSPPEVKLMTGGAEAFPVARPHLRGKYQCYYRYTDDTTKEKGGPVPSNLSEVYELEAGEAATSISWTWTPSEQTTRVTHVELWRSTSGQATTMYRVARIPVETASYLDDLTDEELRDPDRKDSDGNELYAALPILLPNGELNAMRFVPPPADKKAVVKFQDRMWYGVEGELPNAIYYSETDEPESVPEENEIIIQQNDRDSDSLKAMMPFGQTLFLAQERHLFSLSFSQIPLIDGQVSASAYRGAINQRCWQIHEGFLYCADRYGVYRINQGGTVEELSAGIMDQFENDIDWRATEWNYMSIDFNTQTLRLFIVHKEDNPSEKPTRALCMDIDTGAWWTEKYPQQLTGGTQVTLVDGSFTSVHGCPSGVVQIDKGPTDIARGCMLTVTVTDRGYGYRTPPTATVEGGNGARLQAALDQDGQVASIWIFNPGYGYASGEVILSAPDDSTIPASDRRTARATYTASPLTEDLAVWTTYHVRTGNVEYPTDETDKGGGSEQRRDVKLTYQPTQDRNEVSVRMYYNDSDYPRHNVSERDRGTGFVDSTVDPASRLDLGYMLDEYGVDSGVARAIRTGKTIEDIRSNDRHIAVEICGPRRTQDPVVFYTLDVFGGGGS